MIKYNNNTINDWNFGDDNIIKVYKNNAVCYYKVSVGDTAQTPCYAVVDDISQYQDTEFEDVYDKATEKWYKLNNLNEYEEYGIYGSGRTICTSETPFVELSDIVASSTTSVTNHMVTVTPQVGTFSKIRINTTKKASSASYNWIAFKQTETGSEVMAFDLYDIGKMNGLGNGKNYVTDANGSQTFANWVDANHTIVEIDIASLTNNQVSELWLLGYQDNCNPSAASFYMETSSCVTTYEGKLTIDDGYEYQYSGGSWVNVGEVSGSTATLPNVPFTINYNAKNYDSQTKTLFKTSGQLADVDAVISNGTPTVNNGYLTITSNTLASISGYQNYFNRSNTTNNTSLTIISKQLTDGDNCHLLANRTSSYNWMYRAYSDKLTLHGGSEQGGVAITTQPAIVSVRVNNDSSNTIATYNNYTDNTTSAYTPFSYGSENSGAVGLFAGYSNAGNREYFAGDFYWIYMSQSTLTDEQVQQVIAYNEGGGGAPIYPIEYSVKQDPPNNLTFSSMTEAEEYECPWVGMQATIDGSGYTFSGDSQSGYEWVYNPSRLPQGYTEVEYIQNTGTSTSNGAYINTGLELYDVVGNSFSISGKVKSEYYSASGDDDLETIINNEGVSNPYYGFTYRYAHNSHTIELSCKPSNSVTLSSTANSDGSNDIVISCNSTTVTEQVPMGLFASYDGNYNTPYRFAKAAFYSLTVLKNGVTVRDFVPARRDSDSKYGLYDLITDTFYTSPNGNNFSGGNPI